MKQDQIVEQLKQVIVEEMSIYWLGKEIHEATPLFEDGLGIDSVGIVELIALIEERFQVQFSEQELAPETFGNLQQIAGLLVQKQSEKSSNNLAQEHGIS